MFKINVVKFKYLVEFIIGLIENEYDDRSFDKLIEGRSSPLD